MITSSKTKSYEQNCPLLDETIVRFEQLIIKLKLQDVRSYGRNEEVNLFMLRAGQ